MKPRHLEHALRLSLADTPAVFLAGPRQVGKTTLARALAAGRPARRYFTFDDATTLAAAAADPQGFVVAFEGPVVIDEVQRVPSIFLALKLSIDRDRRAGRFLLTGSADPLLVPSFADSLAGRIEIRTLWPFSQGELAGVVEGFVDRLFGTGDIEPSAESRAALVARALAGGYPEALARRDDGRRRDWHSSYVDALLGRDVRELASIERLAQLPRLLALVAARSASSLNAADLGRDAALPYATLRRYLSLLEAVHLIRLVPAWSTNASARLVKAPKLIVTDSGLAAHLAGWTAARLALDPAPAGPLLETFVGMELVKQLGWSRVRAALHWFRTRDGREVDFVLEADDGRVVGVEVKASVSLGRSDFAGLEALADHAGPRFHRGVVLYAGGESIPFGERFAAVPMPSLWSGTRARR